jgi:hypothetical protein
MAVIARFALLHACPELAKARDAAMAAAAADATAAASSSASSAAKGGGGNDVSSYEGDVWHVLATDLEVAIEKAISSGKTPLVLDGTSDKAVDAHFLYAPATIVEAKQLVLQVRQAGVSLDDAREGLRKQLMHAMRYGHILVVRLANSAADFKGTYCTDDAFPHAVFERPKWPSDASLEASASCTSPFAKVLRPKDVAGAGGRFHVSRDFRVVLTSTFKPDSYARLLGEALPLAHLQPIHIVERMGNLELTGAHERMKGRTAGADAEGIADQISLLAERRQAEDEEKENALAKVKG